MKREAKKRCLSCRSRAEAIRSFTQMQISRQKNLGIASLIHPFCLELWLHSETSNYHSTMLPCIFHILRDMTLKQAFPSSQNMQDIHRWPNGFADNHNVIQCKERPVTCGIYMIWWSQISGISHMIFFVSCFAFRNCWCMCQSYILLIFAGLNGSFCKSWRPRANCINMARLQKYLQTQ